MDRIRTIKTSLVLTFIMLVLSACASNPPTFHETDPAVVAKAAAAGGFAGAVAGSLLSSGAAAAPSAAAGAGLGVIAGAVLGHAMSNQKMPPKRILIDAGVQIVDIGENTLLLLPSHVFFHQDSSHVNEGYYIVLNALAEYIKGFDIQTIKVAGYTDELGDSERDLALSRQQAQNVAKYLQGRGINVPFMYSIGYGEQFPIAFNDPGLAEPMNDRVQITYRRLTFGS